MSKTLAKLIERAERTGSANLNGRKHDYNYIGPIEEKYHIELHDNILEFRHWGSTTLLANIETKEVLQFYGIGNSDRDSLNFIASHFKLPNYFRWLPSKDEFRMINEETQEITVI
jgi:hypothetical protein